MTLFEKQNIVLKRDNEALKLTIEAQTEKIEKFQAEWIAGAYELVELRIQVAGIRELLAWSPPK